MPRRRERLVSSNKAALAASIRAPGERGWITLREAAPLFSSKEIDYAFGELDAAPCRSTINCYPSRLASWMIAKNSDIASGN
jgi:hypothetical protein